MNQMGPRLTNVLIMHPDPILCVGIVAALSEHHGIKTLLAGADMPLHGPPVDVVIADYDRAIRLTRPAARSAHGPLHNARIMALTTNDREADVRRAIEAGVHGYLLFGGPLNELVDGVTAIAQGRRYLGWSAAQRLADSLTRASLTSREVDVLRLVVAGESNKAIARRLQIEAGTVKTHMRAILAKLGAKSRTHAAGIASSRGLVEAGAPPASPPLALHAGRRVRYVA